MVHADESDQVQPLNAFVDAVAEMERRELGDFDGLLGQLPFDASQLLRDILTDLRDCVLQKHSEAVARRLLMERTPCAGYCNLTPVADDVALALDLLISIKSATSLEGDRFASLILGSAGARDKKRQAGTRKERRPDITAWIDKQLARNPSVKSPELWRLAPDWLKDQIGERRFAARVTAQRKARASK